MALQTGSIEIDQPPAVVFDYVADAKRRPVWQVSVQKIRLLTPDIDGLGAEVAETRRVPGGTRTFRWRVTEHDRPASWGFRGVGNPINAIVHMDITPSAAGSLVRCSIDFEARGPARLLALLARRSAAREIPRDLAQLKHELEGETPDRTP